MTVKNSSKLLSVVLALAICITTVFGCLMTVSAAEPYYTFTNGIVDTQTNTATIDITFAVPEFEGQLRGGQFSVEEVNPATTYLVLQSVTSKTATVTEEEVWCDTDTGVIGFESKNDNASVTLTLTFGVTGGAVGQTQQFEIKVTELELASRYELVEGTAGTNGIISSGCVHVITVKDYSEQNIAGTDTENGYIVYKNSVCSICDAQFGYQVVPNDAQVEIPDTRKVVYWDGTTDYPTPQDSDGDGIYEITTANELFSLTNGRLTDTAGKTYKVSEDIKAIVLQTKDYADAHGIMGATTINEVNTALSTAEGRSQWQSNHWSDREFAGTFDGNGVTIYGMYASGSAHTNALFGSVTGTATIKNVAVKNSLIENAGRTGTLVASATSTANLTIENCIIANNYVRSTRTGLNDAGVVLGWMDNNDTNSFTMNNCIIYGNDVMSANTSGYAAGITGQVCGDTAGCVAIRNSIIFDCLPYSLNGFNQDSHPDTYTNVYTNITTPDIMPKYTTWGLTWPTSWEGKLDIIETADVQGAAAESLSFDWQTFAPGADGQYPDFRVIKQYKTVADKYKVLYWDGTTEAPTTTDSEGNYIIDTAAKLAYLAQNGGSESYKVPADVKAIVLQPETLKVDGKGIKDAASATETETFFKTTGITPIEWQTNKSTAFSGTLDFSGATVYGMYSATAGTYQGLFGTAADGATVKNVTIKNSYLNGADTRFGMIFAQIPAAANTKGVTVTNCVLTNNYLNVSTGNAGVVIGYFGNGALFNLENIVVCGNSTAWTGNANYKIPLWRSTPTAGSKLTNAILLDLTPNYNNIPNAANDGAYTNVYSDGIDGSPAGMTAITATGVQGSAAETTCGGLDWATTFKATDGYPTLYVFDDPISEFADAALTLAGLNLTYNDDGSVNINFYYNPDDTGMAPDMYVSDTAAAAKKFIKLEAIADATLPAGIPAGSLVYTITNISATRINDLLLPTAIYEGNGTVLWGKTENVSIADYAQAVIDGNGIYYANGTASETVEQDKLVAAAIINYGNSSLNILPNSEYDGTPPVTKETIYAKSATLTPEAPTADTDGVYVIDTVEKLYWVARGDYITSGKNYKVPENIGAFVLQTKEYADTTKLLDATTPEEVQTAFATTDGRTEWELKAWGGSNNDYSFSSTVDFGGATIYGMCCTVAGNCQGLIGVATDGAAVKNFAIKNSYLAGGTYRVGIVFPNFTEALTNGVEISDCVITNNYVDINSNSSGVGFLMGYNTNASSEKTVISKIENIIVAGNDAKWTRTDTPIAPFWRNAPASGSKLTNAILVDITFNWNTLPNAEDYTNVYYTNIADAKAGADITKLESADLVKGAAATTNCPDFDWVTFMPGAEGQYPDFRVPYAEIPAAKTRVEYWDANRTMTQPTATDSEGNIIIDSVANLAWLAHVGNNGYNNTSRNTYKVADDIKAFVLQPQSLTGIMDATSVTETKAFFTDNEASATAWSPADKADFCGTFDGNGATVYGMYVTGSDKGGLFGYTDGSITVKNVAFENCYVNTTAQTGLALAYGSLDTSDSISVSDCLIKNNYLSTGGNSGVLIGQMTAEVAALSIENIIIIGNEFNYSGDTKIPLFRNKAKSGAIVKDVIAFDVMVEYAGNDAADITYTNVNCSVFETTATQAKYGLNDITSADVEGDGAKTLLPNLAWDDLWLINDNGITFMKPSALPDFAQEAYDAMSVTRVNDYEGSSDTFGVYGMTVNLKANPYMTITFAFSDAAGYDDAANQFRKDTTVNLLLNDTTSIHNDSIGNADGTLKEGWSHNKGAGRFHTYRLTGLTVNDLATSTIVVRINRDGDTSNYRATLSLEGFVNELKDAYGVDPCKYYLTRYNAAKALLFYVKMVNARYGS